MTPAQVRAWILLSVPATAGDLSQVIGMADALNKAIPTHAELADSLGWLRATGLVESATDTYRRTRNGHDLVSRLEASSEHAFELWDKLTEALQQMPAPGYELDSLTTNEVDAAYDKYSRDFQAKYKELSEQDD